MRKKIERTLKMDTFQPNEKYIKKDKVVRKTLKVVLVNEDDTFKITHTTEKSENEFKELLKLDKDLEIKMILQVGSSPQKKIDEVKTK